MTSCERCQRAGSGQCVCQSNQLAGKSFMENARAAMNAASLGTLAQQSSALIDREKTRELLERVKLLPQQEHEACQCPFHKPHEKRSKSPYKRSRLLLTDEVYKHVLREQRGVCAICKERCKWGKDLAVDHDHRYGNVRGLLCGRCNRGIGQFDDDPDLLREAANYLDRGLTTDLRRLRVPNDD